MCRRSTALLLAALLLLLLCAASRSVSAATTPTRAAAAATAPSPTTCPTGVRLRKPLASLSDAERRAYVNGMKTLKARGTLDQLSRRHRSGMAWHGTPYFFLMHRALVKDYEDELLKVAPGLTGAPYWDELVDTSGPITQSFVFRQDMLGPLVRGPLRGAFAGLRDDSNNLVTRNPLSLSPRYQWLPSGQVMAAILRNVTTYGQMAKILEVSPHNQYHVMVGGHMGDPSISPSDPTFWVHHVYIDLLWALWQSLSLNNFQDLTSTDLHNGQTAIPLADRVVLYPERWTNRDIVYYRTRLCYQYALPLMTAPAARRLQDDASSASSSTAKKGSGKCIPRPPKPSVPFPTIEPLPADRVARIMPNMSIDAWREVEKRVNEVAQLLNQEVQSGHVNATQLPNVAQLFQASVSNCSMGVDDDDFQDSGIDVVQTAAAQLQAAQEGSASANSTATNVHSGAHTGRVISEWTTVVALAVVAVAAWLV
ncbi:hypothetical protein AMAG_01150 [Allomyces macrogynus ATCC 38327]|uniref:Tyrosinase copper-binding domain-containing protein n=1 Tax=Allomyces macrogynus (strain ATCC 38327) TaxID=578462 RepID=A0A0L0RXW5_ALLM3|nr:hypothetical protein AMAG_01150 [Allomyces macrogynus ATCC 38327]|eukprot:KNE55237.1 hypothetical protein AMAG_01150 [Allomyces macrogynus ATCC 38327]